MSVKGKEYPFWKNPINWLQDKLSLKGNQNEDEPSDKDETYNIKAFTIKFFEDSMVIIRRCDKTAIEFDKSERIHTAVAVPITADTLSKKKSKLIEQRNYSAIIGIITIGGLNFLLLVKTVKLIGSLWGHEIYEINEVKFCPLVSNLVVIKNLHLISEEIAQIKKIFTFGYYFSKSYNLYKPIQYQDETTHDNYYNQFIWNKMLIKNFSGNCGDEVWCSNIISGFFGITEKSDKHDFEYCLLTRKSVNMGGTRFYSRGINHDGYVANFCETEEFVIHNTNVISHIQIRGSVPIFWQQVIFFLKYLVWTYITTNVVDDTRVIQ